MKLTNDQLQQIAQEKIKAMNINDLIDFATEQIYATYLEQPWLAEEDAEILELDMPY